ncbi:hypothetical protein ECFRIK523_2413, partial [Escherichia coli FRIK523]
MSLSSQRKIFW